jgi:lysosomal alpha-mannosidase
LHRRCFYDDNWGVEEALDEPGSDGRGLVVSGKHYVHLGAISSDHRLKANEIYGEPLLGFTQTPNIEQFVKNYTTVVRTQKIFYLNEIC